MIWYVYVASNANHTLYVGITTDPIRRLREHMNGKYEHAFTKRYNFDRMVYYEPRLGERDAERGSANSKDGLARRRSR